MQTLIDTTGPFKLPTHWGEVTTAQFCATDPLETVEARASYFAGRPIQVNVLVDDALAWMRTPPSADVPWQMNIGQCCYLAVETMRAALAGAVLSEAFQPVYGLYSACHFADVFGVPFNQVRATVKADACAGWPITTTYPAVAHCLTELQRLATKYAELSEPDPTEAAARAREAGADELLGIFGHYNVAKAVAQQMGITLDAAYALPWESVALHLLHSRRTAILSDTIQRNAKQSHD